MLCNECKDKFFIIKKTEVITCPKCKCIKCNGKQYIIIKVKNIEYHQICECTKNRIMLLQLRKANIPANHFNMSKLPSLEEYYNTAKQYISNFVENNTKNGLVFYGGIGTGKTTLAIRILKHLIINKKINGIFIQIENLFNDIKKKYDNNLSEVKIINSLVKKDLVVLDDICKITDDWRNRIIDNIITNRHSNKKPTIITTNFNLKDKLCQSTYSRINQQYNFLKFNGIDLRCNEKSI